MSFCLSQCVMTIILGHLLVIVTLKLLVVRSKVAPEASDHGVVVTHRTIEVDLETASDHLDRLLPRVCPPERRSCLYNGYFRMHDYQEGHITIFSMSYTSNGNKSTYMAWHASQSLLDAFTSGIRHLGQTHKVQKLPEAEKSRVSLFGGLPCACELSASEGVRGDIASGQTTRSKA